ncbi:MAG TPA: cell division protein FtsA [bacterium]
MIVSDTLVGIDIGTTKVCTVVARVGSHDGEISIIGIGRAPSRGLRKGRVVDLDRTIQSITESKKQAEHVAGVEIDSAYIGITGSHVEATPANAVVAVTNPQRGITAEDAERALDLAKRVEIPQGRRLIDARVKEYIVDGNIGIMDPVGMSGMRLEVNALLITAASNQLENIYRAVDHAGMDVEDAVIAPIASSEAVLSEDEKEIGVAVIDIGGGTTDLVVFQQGGISHLAVYPVGGDHFDSDLAYGIGITSRQAEHLKVQLGGVSRQYLMSEDLIEISKSGGEKKEAIPLKIIGEIIFPRLEEILRLVNRELRETGLISQIPSGIVLTGGTSMLTGIMELASEVFGVQVRIGYPTDIAGLSEEVRNPMYATSVGLIKLGSYEYRERYPRGIPAGFPAAFDTARDWTKTVLRSIFR